jgi:hypothetical protein
MEIAYDEFVDVAGRSSPVADINKQLETCDICGGSFEYGPNRYAGRWLRRYEMLACDGCLRGNHDGSGPFAESRILAHLNRKGLRPPARNEKGWLPME